MATWRLQKNALAIFHPMPWQHSLVPGLLYRSSLRKKQPAKKRGTRVRAQPLDLRATGSGSEGDDNQDEGTDDQDAADQDESAADKDDSGPEHPPQAGSVLSDGKHGGASDGQTTRDLDEPMSDGLEPENPAHDATFQQPRLPGQHTMSSPEEANRQDAGLAEAYHDISTSHSERTEGDSEGAQPNIGKGPVSHHVHLKTLLWTAPYCWNNNTCSGLRVFLQHCTAACMHSARHCASACCVYGC